MFKVQTTYREFNDAYLNALENDELSSFEDDLLVFPFLYFDSDS